MTVANEQDGDGCLRTCSGLRPLLEAYLAALPEEDFDSEEVRQGWEEIQRRVEELRKRRGDRNKRTDGGCNHSGL